MMFNKEVTFIDAPFWRGFYYWYDFFFNESFFNWIFSKNFYFE